MCVDLALFLCSVACCFSVKEVKGLCKKCPTGDWNVLLDFISTHKTVCLCMCARVRACVRACAHVRACVCHVRSLLCMSINDCTLERIEYNTPVQGNTILQHTTTISADIPSLLWTCTHTHTHTHTVRLVLSG